jgi:anti-sigma regulatory factor (Ser/Thr protein kinase)
VSPASYTGFLPHSSTSVRQARSQLAAALYERDVLGSLVDDAVLILSEFVTNSLRHARALDSGLIRIAWELTGEGLLRIEVTDGGGTTRPSTKPYSMSVSAHAGRGLEIVDRLADRWGSQREEGGDEYTVWAELAVRARHAGRRLRAGGSGAGSAAGSRTGRGGGEQVTARAEGIGGQARRGGHPSSAALSAALNDRAAMGATR